MEFENVNNINLAIEASAKKLAKSKKTNSRSLVTSAVHKLKKWLKRAKPVCACAAPEKTQEEIDNDLNEMLEAKNNHQLLTSSQVDSDLRPFRHITNRQLPERQVRI